jgi:hypothetical protein
MTFDEEFELLKRVADKVPQDYKQQLSFLKTQKRDFNGDYWFFNTDNIRNFNGKISFIPVKVKVMSSAGHLNIYISCDVIFENVNVNDNDMKKMLDILKLHISSVDSFRTVSGLFWSLPEEEFNKLARLIGMSKFKLHVNNIILK